MLQGDPCRRSSLSSNHLVKSHLPQRRQSPGLPRKGLQPLTWLVLHIQQGDVVVQVGNGALGRAAPSRLGSGKHIPGEVQGALAATLLVAATEKVGERGEPRRSQVSGEGRARPRLPHEPRFHAAADSSHRTFITDFPKPEPDFFPVPSPPGPSGATLPLGRQTVTAAITQGEGMTTHSPLCIKVTNAGESCLCCHVVRSSDTRWRSRAGLRASEEWLSPDWSGCGEGKARPRDRNNALG